MVVPAFLPCPVSVKHDFLHLSLLSLSVSSFHHSFFALENKRTLHEYVIELDQLFTAAILVDHEVTDLKEKDCAEWQRAEGDLLCNEECMQAHCLVQNTGTRVFVHFESDFALCVAACC